MTLSVQDNKLTVGSYDLSSLILLQCITPVHVGSGRGSSVVDLPVQKDAFGYPTIFSSSLKGAIRVGSGDEIYGSEDFAGAFTPLDAKVLFIPVRSLFGVYCLATCPFLLKSFKQYLDMCNPKNKLLNLEAVLAKVKNITSSMLVASQTGQRNFGIPISSNDNSSNSSNNKKQYAILADEFKLEIVIKDEIESLAELGINEEQQSEDKWRVVVVSDDLMRNNLINRSMITATRIKIEGVAKQNALWTEESVPEKTIFYTVFFYSKSRGKESLPSNQVQRRIEEKVVGKYTMFGGHETTGRGITKVSKVI